MRDPILATVGEHNITAADLKAEMAAAPVTDEAHRKMTEDSLLRNMIARDILADAARAQGLDKSRAFQRDKTRLVDALLVQALQTKLAAAAAPPTLAEAQAFMASHPNVFAERKIFTFDQVRMAPPTDPSLVKALGAQTSLDQIAQLLTRNKVAFQRNAASLDALGAQPDLVEALAKTPVGQLFVLPQAGVLSVNAITEVKTVPFTGPDAVAYAQKLLSAEGAQGAVQSGLKAIFAKSAKQVQIAKGYEAADPIASIGKAGHVPGL